EAMGEITAGHAGLADEFACIVVSYINPDGNFLEHEMLQRGSLWAVGRLSHARPALAAPAAAFLPGFFSSPDPFLRGTAAWAAGPIVNDALAPLLKALQPDDAPLRLYRQRQITETTVGSLAKAALAAGTR
ncbi:MAG: HEAT repeat domain-containing protein, partial [Desulfosarcina sp.]|nr:HEAT repeat domain-containing protein [Desulfosarcina sp.]MBC2767895.1 HEAT repeat domain-containing protein [Desulfosarcina sp.]